jgi:hypothetical protein
MSFTTINEERDAATIERDQAETRRKYDEYMADRTEEQKERDEADDEEEMDRCAQKLKSLLGDEWIYFVEETRFDSDIASDKRYYLELDKMVMNEMRERLNNQDKLRIWQKIISGEIKI